MGAWLCFTIITSPVAQGIQRNCSGECDHDGISAALCSQSWCPGGKKPTVCDKGKASHLGPLANPGPHMVTGLREQSGLWEKPLQGNVLLADAY